MSNFLRINYGVKIAVLTRALRSALAMNQDELAVAAGCSRPTVNRIEALDKASPRGDTVDEIFQVFRQMGAEIQMGDEEVSIKFGREALLKAEERIRAGYGRTGPRMTAVATVVKSPSSE